MGSEVLGLIAGCGRFPLEVARGARQRGQRVEAIAFLGGTDPAINAAVEGVTWLHAGQVGRALEALLSAGVREVVMAGKVPKITLIDDPGALKLDPSAIELIQSLPDRRDASILGAVAQHLEDHGIRLRAQWDSVPFLMADEGPLGKIQPTPELEAEIEFAWPIAKTVAGQDIGQLVAVKDRAVLAVEAIEGTDAAIRRAGSLTSGACVVKVAKGNQDPRFDLPAIGRDTAESLVAARAAALVFEARMTVVLDREELVEIADAHGIALLGIAPERFTKSEPRGLADDDPLAMDGGSR